MIRPADRRVFIKEDPIPEKTEGGIILLDKTEKNQKIGTVTAIGKNVTEVGVGTRVVFIKGKDAVKVNGEEVEVVFMNPKNLALI